MKKALITVAKFIFCKKTTNKNTQSEIKGLK
jgi:hypothetical protein